MVLVSTGVLASGSAAAQVAMSGAGAMRCTTVIGRLSSQNSADRMVVLSWVQGYLAGVVSTRSALAPAAPLAAAVPEYDALGPRVLTLCKADPTSDLHHVAGQFFAVASAGR
jgi:hypothetical protein